MSVHVCVSACKFYIKTNIFTIYLKTENATFITKATAPTGTNKMVLNRKIE